MRGGSINPTGSGHKGPWGSCWKGRSNENQDTQQITDKQNEMQKKLKKPQKKQQNDHKLKCITTTERHK